MSHILVLSFIHSSFAIEYLLLSYYCLFSILNSKFWLTILLWSSGLILRSRFEHSCLRRMGRTLATPTSSWHYVRRATSTSCPQPSTISKPTKADENDDKFSWAGYFDTQSCALYAALKRVAPEQIWWNLSHERVETHRYLKNELILLSSSSWWESGV